MAGQPINNKLVCVSKSDLALVCVRGKRQQQNEPTQKKVNSTFNSLLQDMCGGSGGREGAREGAR